MNHRLKLTRVALSLCCIILLTATIVGLMPSSIGKLLIDIQFMHLVLYGAAGWIILWLVITLVFGRIYCSSVCPMGTLLDILAYITRGKRRYAYAQPYNTIRYTILTATVLCIIIPVRLIPDLLAPDSAYTIITYELLYPAAAKIKDLSGLAPIYVAGATTIGFIAALAFLAVIAAFARKGGRSFCNTVCPVGTILSFVSRNAIIHFDIDTDTCTHCGLCSDVCKAQCLDHQEGIVDMSRCVVCFNCTDACRDKAINYTRRRHRLSTPMMRRIKGTTRSSRLPEPSLMKDKSFSKK